MKSGFDDIGLKTGLHANLDSLGYKSMTPIQSKSLPAILEGRDVIAQAKTGSGKTAAFGLGLLQKLVVEKFRVQVLVLCPTRELADQVAREIRSLGRGIHNIKVLTLCGGTPFGPQLGSLEHGAHIIVGTPGRVEEHLRKKTLDLTHLTVFVLDEADRMLDMGFQPILDTIAGYLPGKRQTLLFSATYPDKIEQLSARLMHEPFRVTVDAEHDTSSIVQYLYKVTDNDNRMEALRLLILQHQPESTLVFCNTRQQTDEVATELRRNGFSAQSIHGELEQRDRDLRLLQFSNKSLGVLVATDLAARGLDIDKLDLVVNYHLSPDTEVHTHRVGRTGRAGSVGMACSLYNDRESYKVGQLDEQAGYQLQREPLPAESLLAKPPPQPTMVTLQIDGGKKQKIRAGDILGALTVAGGINGDQVGKIKILDQSASIAIHRDSAKTALTLLGQGKVKGRSFRVRRL